MKKVALLCAFALIAGPLAAQGNAPMTYEDRVTCGALIFLGSQSAEDPTMEQQFAAHHISKAIEMSGKPQDVVVADTERRMAELGPAFEADDPVIGAIYSNCIMTLINEFQG